MHCTCTCPSVVQLYRGSTRAGRSRRFRIMQQDAPQPSTWATTNSPTMDVSMSAESPQSPGHPAAGADADRVLSGKERVGRGGRSVGGSRGKGRHLAQGKKRSFARFVCFVHVQAQVLYNCTEVQRVQEDLEDLESCSKMHPNHRRGQPPTHQRWTWAYQQARETPMPTGMWVKGCHGRQA